MEERRTPPGTGPLAGIRVVDLTRVVMGPLATQILADQGADVIMIEPRHSDINRLMGPGPHEQLSGVSLNMLRNKRSVVLDLKSPEGRDAVLQLIAGSDVVVTTLLPGALDRLGLDYESVLRVRPDVVYCQAQGFPLGSPQQDDPAYDDIIQAATGVADLTERVWGEPGLLPTIFADKVCGLVIAQAVAAALFQRERTGQGQHVEVPMHQAMTAFMLAEHGAGGIPEPPLRQGDLPPTGYRRILSRDRRPHPTRDGLVHMLPYLPRHYRRLFGDAGMPGADSDPRYADARATITNSDSLYRDVRALCRTRTTDEWLAYCKEVGIPATRVASLQDMADGLPLADHPAAGRYRVLPAMANFRGHTAGVRRPAPLVGEHTAEVLGQITAEDPVPANDEEG